MESPEAVENEATWERLETLTREADPAQIEAFLDELPCTEVAHAISRVSDETQVQLFQCLAPAEAADLVERLPDAQAASLIEALDTERAAAIVNELPSNEQADLLGELHEDDAAAIIAALPADEVEEARELIGYDDDVAGGLMITEILSYPKSFTVADVIEDLGEHAEEYRRYDVQYAYVVGDAEHLVGVLPMRDLLLARRRDGIESLMIPSPISVSVDATLEEIQDIFDRYAFFGIPVVDAGGRLRGLVQRSAAEEAWGERAESDRLKADGIVGGEELRTMPLLRRARRRLSWLSVNILLNLAAATIIATYQDTLAAVIALAVFLPMISDMSGCSGNQAVAVSMRELTLGLAKPGELFRVWSKEITVGIINGIVLGSLLGVLAWVWKGNAYLGLVVGGAMALNTMVAVSIGGCVPLFLKRLKLDPALASGPILTTVTDMCGFFLVLSFASAALEQLQST